ncbi:glycoside hydrolase family 6 protein [Thermothelomyces thermophilus ATCC 42464]|uniref:Glucanase n=1 Tax=Thermothelomyces thermophilus (strain ATCC 42464 / BCRC 31852 / DSM 1799) TaxID=573729 RepID=G2QFW6_THET4|nr:glycoside hydrolase family 6 protein [Thermothelomyces thermophilus ATCC 42464]AEO59280.1 glycoside hydrolase family 6 protein [Thermothelomyces thermophilus ATCC 42464]UIX35934.1 cellobiohydrolase [synthetic construct]
MKFVQSATLAFAATALAAPSRTTPQKPRQASAGCASAVTLDASTNVFQQYTLHPNNFYRAEVEAAAEAISDSALAEKARKVADVGTFLWLDTIENIGRLEPALEDVPCENIVGLVIYDLPGRDCAAKASNGELKVGELDRYKTEYIDKIAEILKAHSNTAFALVIEPDSLPNLVTNSDLQTCQQSASGYREGVAYALKQLNLPNVVMYIDAGHGGWLGWDANLKPGAQELASVYKSAGSPSQVRGISTNVAGWNAWDQEPGEFSDASDAQYNKCQNEKIYINTFGAELKSAGMPNHAIIDTGRNGVTGLRDEWGDWCNVNGAGFGVRPTANTGDELADAFVWVKPGGESDGTSDSSAARYDSFCGKPDAFKPSPEAGTWNQAYFEMLLKNANPSF